jgi:hypothetical protein
MKRSTKVLLLLGAVQVILTVGTLGYFLLFEVIVIGWLIGAIKAFLELAFKLGLAVGIIWWLYRIVKRDVSTPDNAIVVGMSWWLAGQVIISLLLGASMICPRCLPLFAKLSVIEADWLLILVELIISFLCGLTGFFVRRIVYKEPMS